VLCAPSQNWPAWESEIPPPDNCNIDSKEHALASLGGFVSTIWPLFGAVQSIVFHIDPLLDVFVFSL
jgi:hypothetical protein